MEETTFSRKLAATADKHVKERDYWLDQMSGDWVKTVFPPDSEMPGGQTRESDGEVQFLLPGGLYERLNTMSRQADPMLHVILVSAVVLLLDRYNFNRQDNRDIIVGSPVFRQEGDAAYINTVLALRHRYSTGISFKELLMLAKDTIAGATGHVNYPIESLLLKLGVSDRDQVFPLFDVAVLLENIHDLKDILHTRPNMIFSFRRSGEGLRCRLIYNTLRYRPETVEGIARHYVQLLKNSLFQVECPLNRIDIAGPEEKALILDQFNATAAPYPRDAAIHELFDRAALERPHKVAVVVEDHALTYYQLEQRANRLANYLVRDRGVRPEQCIGVMMEKSADLMVAVLGILKAGAVYVPIDHNFPEEVIKNMMDDAAIQVVISRKRHVRALNRLQWDCPSFNAFLCMDTDAVYREEESEKSELMGRKLWEYVGEKATDEVTGGGWTSSYTGLPIPKEEMDQYGDNILEKLKPLLHKEMRVLEIGCASGISMYRIAPLVGLYYGTDISGVIIDKNRQRIEEEGHENIRLARLAAHEIDQVEEEGFDLVIINSVIQCFHGHNYLRRVLAKAMDKLSDRGFLFLGDLMDQDKKARLIADFTEFKQSHRETDYKTKTDWSVELFVSRDFLSDLRLEMPDIREAAYSGKIYTMENELTRYRYDALLTIDKIGKTGAGKEETSVKHKHQHDLGDLSRYETDAPALPSIPHEPNRLAYIMYTSGSTGRPKGVMVEHPSVVRLVKNTNYVEFPEDGKILQTGALAFDASTFEIWGALLNGMTLYLLPREKILSPADLKQGIRNYGITTMWMTAPLFNRMLEEDIEIFSGLRNLLTGGDVLSPAHINRLRKKYPSLNVINGYGPTENTTFSTTFLIERDYDGPIPIGRPIANSYVYILDGNGQLLPAGIAGELWVGGDGVSRGYLNNPELTAEKFTPLHSNLLPPNMRNSGGVGSPLERGARRAGCVHTGANAPLYRTGDLARWMPDGALEFLGRIDTQVKIRGFRIEVEEIENRLKEIGEVADAVVIARGGGSGEGKDKVLCGYFLGDGGKKLDPAEVRDYLSRCLPDFMVPAYLVQLESIPLTANGKVDRRALPEPVSAGGENRAVAETPLQRRLVELWAGVLDRDAHSAGIDDNFFQCGGHSLKATVLVTRIHQALDVKIPLAEIFRLPTIRELAAYIEESGNDWRDKHYAVTPAELKEYYPLSSAQLRLYILSRWDPAGLNYNIPMAMKISGTLDRSRLEQVFHTLVHRHESFRTAFIEVDSRPMQRILPVEDVAFEIEYFDVSGLAQEDKDPRCHEIASDTFIRPFDLSKAPLLRVGLIKQSDLSYVLMVDMHHSISDGTSLRVLMGEFAALYGGVDLPELKLQYRDFALWRERESKGILDRQEKYWLERFSGEIPVLNLPYDFPRPAMQSFEGGFADFELSAEETDGLKHLASQEGATLFMTLLAAFNVFLSRLSGQEDIVIGTPVAGRRHADLHHLVGMFVNTLCFRNFPRPGKTFRQLLAEVKSCTLTAYDNQEYPFEELVERLRVSRDTGRNPLFDVMFALHNMELVRGFIPETGDVPEELQFSSYPFPFDVSKFDMTFHGRESDGTVSFMLEYCTRLFKEETILEFIKYFRKTIREVVDEPGMLISDIEVLDHHQKSAILEFSNGEEFEIDSSETLHGWFARQVEETPDHVAVVAMAGAISVNTYLTYKELNRRALCLARGLRKRGAGVESVIGLMVERSAQLIVSMLAIMNSGAAYLAIDPELPDSRKRFMLQDGDVRMMLTDKDEAAIRSFIPPGMDVVDVRQSYIYEDYGDGVDDEYPDVSGANLLYVIYTSGSTGRPKGLMIEHRNMVNLFTHQFRSTNIDCGRILQFATIVFDVATQEIFSALLSGGAIYMINPQVRGDVPELFRYAGNHHISTLFLPVAFLKMIFSQPGYIAMIPSSINHIVTAGEQVVVPPSFRDYLKQHGVYLHNHYGPAETHVITTYTVDPQGDIPQLPSIGKPLLNTSIYIVDTSMRLVLKGVPGQLCATGLQVGRGYLNNPGLTNSKFQYAIYGQLSNLNSQSPNSSNKGSSSGAGFPLERGIIGSGSMPARSGGVCRNGRRAQCVIYKTGDLARWLPDGNIQFLGRIDTQVKIRGFRIEMGEIETCLLKYHHIDEAVVKAIDAGGEKFLCAYIVSAMEQSDTLVREYMATSLPDYMVPAHFVLMEKMPLTPSGKIDRKALPMPQLDDMAGAEEYTAPQGPVEEKLVEAWATVLDIPAKRIGVKHNFFSLGGQSLKATILVSKIHKALDIKLQLTDIFRMPTVRGLAQYIKETGGDGFEKHYDVEPCELREYYPLSPAQMRLYLLYRMDPYSINYNLPMILVLKGEIHKAKLSDVFLRLIRRHESFRTSFIQVNQRPWQHIAPPGETGFELEYFDVSGMPENEGDNRVREIASQRFIRPFDLSRAPLLRAGLIKQSGIRYILMVDMHHSISDGTSLTLLVEEFAVLYSGGELPGLKLQYRDFAMWQKRESRRTLEKQKSFWLEQFSGEIPLLELPYDFPRPPVQNFEGAFVHFRFTAQETLALNRFAGSLDVTLYMILLAIFNILLQKLSGRDDIVVGSPVAGRGHTDLQHVAGMFVNTLALRNYPDAGKTFCQLAAEIKQVTLAAFENQQFQFEELVDLLRVNRDTGRNPLFDVVFALQNMAPPAANPLELDIQPFDYEFNVSKFDLTLHAVEREGVLEFKVEYATSLFKESTIHDIIKYFRKITLAVLENSENLDKPGTIIREIEILTQQEKAHILEMSTGPAEDYETGVFIQQLFTRQAGLYPDRVAVESDDGPGMSYRKLNRRADELGMWLIHKGILPGDIVAVKMDRGMELIIAILGILKAGGVYLPIDTAYPEERVKYMLADSGARLVLTEPLETPGVKSGDEPGKGEDGREPGSAAYVIYTSGSTGRPKGVLVPHQGIINMADFHWRTFGSGESRRFSQVSSPGFDAMCLEMWPSLLKGGTLCIVPGDLRMDPVGLKQWLIDRRIHVSFQSTAVAQALLDEQWPEEGVVLRALLTGGDRLTRYPSKKYPFSFYNLYGLTETTVYSTCNEIPVRAEGGGTPTIGKPIANHTIYILGPGNEIRPIGVPGEICIGGHGIAHGYLNNPELTAERFPQARPGHRSHRSYRSYKTGDLARWQPDGNIEFLGRIDQQVKVRGYRIEPGEIETVLQAHEDVKEAVVITLERADGNLLAAYVTPQRETQPPDSSRLTRYLESRLPSYMVPSAIMCIEAFPLTPSGKVDRRALPEPGLESGLAEAPRDEIESGLQRIWAEVLELEPAQISVLDDFFRIGGHSLRVTLMTSRVEKYFNVRIPMVDVFRTPRLRDLAEYIKGAGKSFYETIGPVEKKEYYPASSAQKRLFFLDNIENIGTSYNIFNALVLTGDIAGDALQTAFRQLIRRHEALRTAFIIAGDQAVQRVVDEVEFELEKFDSPGGSGQQVARRFLRRFDLSRAPLLRAGLVRLEPDRYLLMMDLHHIISDGTSMGILSRDLIRLYSGQVLPPLKVHYKDFTSWQNRLIQSGAMDEQENYWLDRFKDVDSLPVLTIPTDFPRAETLSFEGDTYLFTLGAEESAALKRLSSQHGATLYMNLMAILNVLLFKYSGQRDIILGSGIMGRPHADLEPLIGMFINSLALRNFPQPHKSYGQFLDEVKECSITAFENQDMQFEVLVDKLGIERDPGRNPLFDVLFVVQNFQRSEIDVKGVTFSPFENEWKTSKFDLTLFAYDNGDELMFNLEYSTGLFKRTTIEKMARHFTEILNQVVANPSLKLGDITMSHQLTAIRSDGLLEEDDDFEF